MSQAAIGPRRSLGNYVNYIEKAAFADKIPECWIYSTNVSDQGFSAVVWQRGCGALRSAAANLREGRGRIAPPWRRSCPTWPCRPRPHTAQSPHRAARRCCCQSRGGERRRDLLVAGEDVLDVLLDEAVLQAGASREHDDRLDRVDHVLAVAVRRIDDHHVTPSLDQPVHTLKVMHADGCADEETPPRVARAARVIPRYGSGRAPCLARGRGRLSSPGRAGGFSPPPSSCA